MRYSGVYLAFMLATGFSLTGTATADVMEGPPATLKLASAPNDKTSSRDRKANAGYQLVAGPEFSIQVKLTETLASAVGDRKITLYVYDYVVTDNSSGKIHGGRGKNRLEASVNDMEKSSRWQFKDLNGDGYTDFRYYKGDVGSPEYWWAEVWQEKGKHFTFSRELSGK